MTELEQVTLNLVVNALQSIAVAGRNDGRVDDSRFSTMVRRCVSRSQDNGPGVQLEDEPKLFQPFFTTKPVGKGRASVCRSATASSRRSAERSATAATRAAARRSIFELLAVDVEQPAHT